jgi:hypothetical protein
MIEPVPALEIPVRMVREFRGKTLRCHRSLTGKWTTVGTAVDHDGRRGGGHDGYRPGIERPEVSGSAPRLDWQRPGARRIRRSGIRDSVAHCHDPARWNLRAQRHQPAAGATRRALGLRVDRRARPTGRPATQPQRRRGHRRCSVGHRGSRGLPPVHQRRLRVPHLPVGGRRPRRADGRPIPVPGPWGNLRAAVRRLPTLVW